MTSAHQTTAPKKIINKQGQMAGRLGEGKVTTVMLWDLAKALKEYNKEQDLIEFLKERGFRVED